MSAMVPVLPASADADFGPKTRDIVTVPDSGRAGVQVAQRTTTPRLRWRLSDSELTERV